MIWCVCHPASRHFTILVLHCQQAVADKVGMPAQSVQLKAQMGILCTGQSMTEVVQTASELMQAVVQTGVS